MSGTLLFDTDTLETPGAGVPAAMADRGAEAAAVARFILEATTQVVVLYGKPRSGKSQLIRQWLLPHLRQELAREQIEVAYGKCDRELPPLVETSDHVRPLDDVLARRSIVFVDSFERVLDRPPDEQHRLLAPLFARLTEADADSRLVLITDLRQLTNVYALSEFVPRIGESVLELNSTTVEEGLARLSDTDPETAVVYTPEALVALGEQCRALEQQGFDVSFELLQLIDRRFREAAVAKGDRSVDAADVREARGVIGILGYHLVTQLWQLGFRSQEEIDLTVAVLEDIEDVAGAQRANVDLGAMSRRIGVDEATVARVFAALTGPNGALVESGTGGLIFVPPQTAAVMRTRLAEGRGWVDQAYRIVDEGVRSWTELGTLLPRRRFVEVHAERRLLLVNPEQARFLLLCALRLEDEDTADASRYWLRRIDDAGDAEDILLSSVLDADPGVSARAAILLRDFPSPHARERLTFLVLVHEHEEVRRVALASLEAMRNEEVRDRLIDEASDGRSPRRRRAVEALAIFRDDQTATLLKRLVNDRDTSLDIRTAAVHALGHIGTGDSVDALLDIAMRDPDVEDRDAAALALANTRSPELNGQIIDRLGPLDRRPWLWRSLAGAVALGGVVAAYVVMVNETMLLPLMGAFALFILSVLLVWPTTRLLVGVKNGRIPRRSVRGVLAWLLFGLWALTVAFVVHGSAHALIRRWRRAVLLLVLQVLGLFLAWASQLFADILWGGVQQFYVAVGLALVVGTYLYDVLAVLFESLVLTGATAQRRRTTAVYTAVFGNTEMAALVLDGVRSDRPAEAALARHLWNQFGGCASAPFLVERLKRQDPVLQPFLLRALRTAKRERVLGDLAQMWEAGDSRLRSNIAAILYRRPTESSLELLGRLRGRLAPWARLRYYLARYHYLVRVWPAYLRVLGVVSLPAVAVFAFHGVRALQNPAWSPLMDLRRSLHQHAATPWFSTARSDSAVLLTIEYLARRYPEQSADELLQHLNDTELARQPRMRGAVAAGLVAMAAGDLIQSDLRHRILEHDTTIAGALMQSDAQDLERALDHLLRGADAVRPPVRIEASLSLLTALIVVRDSAGARDARHRAVATLGQVRYDRALPVLDSLLTRRRTDSVIGSRLAAELENVSLRAHWGVQYHLNPDGEILRLAQILNRLGNEPAIKVVVDSLARQVQADPIALRSHYARSKIVADPLAENGYRQVLQAYLDSARYDDAVEVFARLKVSYPRSVWPYKILSELHHEYRPAAPGAFEQSYVEASALQELAAFAELRDRNRSLYLRLQADIAEIALSAGRFAVSEQLADEIERDPEALDYQRYNAALFRYVGRVMRRDAAGAQAALGGLERLLRGFPADFYNNWVYPGTRVFIRNSDLPGAMKSALLELCVEGEWEPTTSTDRVLAMNREALATLAARERSTPR